MTLSIMILSIRKLSIMILTIMTTCIIGWIGDFPELTTTIKIFPILG